EEGPSVDGGLLAKVHGSASDHEPALVQEAESLHSVSEFVCGDRASWSANSTSSRERLAGCDDVARTWIERPSHRHDLCRRGRGRRGSGLGSFLPSRAFLDGLGGLRGLRSGLLGLRTVRFLQLIQQRLLLKQLIAEFGELFVVQAVGGDRDPKLLAQGLDLRLQLT